MKYLAGDPAPIGACATKIYLLYVLGNCILVLKRIAGVFLRYNEKKCVSEHTEECKKVA